MNIIEIFDMTTLNGLRSKSFIVLMLLLQVIVYFVVYLDIPFARAVICILYLLFIPGIVALKLLSIKNLAISEKIFFSVALSVAFLMFTGAIINGLVGMAVTNPLSLNVLILSINTIVLVMSFFAARQNESIFASQLQLKSSKLIFLCLVSASILLLGSYGIFIVSNGGSSIFLMLLVIAISLIVSVVFISEKIIPSSFYPLILLIICICALFFLSSDTALFSKYISGNGDYWIEFYAFKITAIPNFWNSAATDSIYTGALFPTYSMLSITILPTIFSVISGVEYTFLFKCLYPLILCFIALGAYKLYQTQTDRKVAFLATFFLIIISLGKGWGSGKQEIADLFYVALFLLLFRKDISPSKKSILLIVFGAGLAVSHYGITYIFLLTLLLAFMILVVMNYLKTGKFSSYQNKIPLVLLLIFTVITFSWYSFVNASVTINLLSDVSNTVVSNLGQFFNPDSRGTALEGLGVIQTTSIFNSISAALFIFTEVLLVIGFIKLIRGKNKDSTFSIEYKVFAALNMVIIAVNILIPTIADTFVMSRFYQTTLIILAPLAILGGKTIIDLIPKVIPKIKIQKFYAPILVFLVFIPLFLFQTGFVFEATKVHSSSLPLSMYRMSSFGTYDSIVDDQQVASAIWIPSHFNVTDIHIYSDYASQYNVLTAYSLLERGRISYFSNNTIPYSNQIIFLANTNLIQQGYIFNAPDISPIIKNQNTIYSNGKSVIFKGCGP
jgi:uncharacterized membrane protein